MKRYFLSIIFFLVWTHCFTQDHKKDEIIFKAMQDEMNRNYKDLSLPDAPEPFFIGYMLSDCQYLKIKGSLGSIITSVEYPLIRNHAVRLLVGDYKCNNEFKYDGPRYPGGKSTIENNYGQLKRDFWLTTDQAYKQACQDYSAKTALLKQQNLTEEEMNLEDLLKIETITKINNTPQMPLPDKNLWEKNIRGLSAIFKKYKNLYDTDVELSVMYLEIYYKTTEGTTLKQPVNIISLVAKASVRAEDGTVFSDSYSVQAQNENDMPSIEKLEKRINEFAEKLIRLKDAEPVNEYYYGPVLFEKQAAFHIFSENFVTTKGLITYRKPEDIGAGNLIEAISKMIQQKSGRETSLNSRIGKRIIDSRFSVKNYTSLKEYKGKKLFGFYEVDADGLVPKEELTLVDNGILKGFLSSRIPTLGAKESTGSNRFGADVSRLATYIAPGSVHIIFNGGVTEPELKKNLLESAIREGLDYAYIIRKMGGASISLYKVDVKTGEEKMMRSAGIDEIKLSKLRRVLGVSNNEEVVNYLYNSKVPVSMIFPSAILLEDIEIYEPQTPKKEKPFPLVNPLLRNE